MAKEQIILIPGLSDGVKNLEIATSHWKRDGFEIHIFPMKWKDKETDMDIRIYQIISLANNLKTQGNVTLIGTSAGGSAAFNVFLRRPDLFKYAVSVCARLKSGNNVGFRSFEKRTTSSHAFRQSVTLLENALPTISNGLKKRMLTVSAKFGDELVPKDTSFLDGANNIRVPCGEHMLSIAMSLTLFSKRIKNFIIFGNVNGEKIKQ